MWSPRIQKAIDIAAVAHAHHRRKGNPLPFIVHVVGVAAILAESGADEDTVIAGYLHDILEDVKPEIYSREDMVRDFGEQVADIVDGVTEDITINNWQSRKHQYLEGLKGGRLESLLVSAADMANNMHALHTAFMNMGKDSDDIYSSTPEERLWFYEERYNLLRDQLGEHPVLDILTQQWDMARNDTASLTR